MSDQSSSTPPSTGTIKATAVPGALPDTAPFVWDEAPAELTEALDEIEQACATYAIYQNTASRRVVSLRLTNARAALESIYNRQREEMDIMHGMIAGLSSQIERLTEVRDDLLRVIGADLKAGDARLALRNWLTNRTGMRTIVPAYMGVAQMVKGWNAWLAGAVQWHLKRPVVGMEIPEIQEP